MQIHRGPRAADERQDAILAALPTADEDSSAAEVNVDEIEPFRSPDADRNAVEQLEDGPIAFPTRRVGIGIGARGKGV
jgi:hypothetical protein